MPQPHKGPRKLMTARVHDDVYDRLAAEAKRLGVHKGEVVAHALCELLGMPEHDPLRQVLASGEEQMRMTA